MHIKFIAVRYTEYTYTSVQQVLAKLLQKHIATVSGTTYTCVVRGCVAVMVRDEMRSSVE